MVRLQNDISHRAIVSRTTTGIVPISVESFPFVVDSLFINTTTEMPQEFPFTLDYNSGDTIGFGKYDTVDRGYISLPQSLRGPNKAGSKRLYRSSRRIQGGMANVLVDTSRPKSDIRFVLSPECVRQAQSRHCS